MAMTRALLLLLAFALAGTSALTLSSGKDGRIMNLPGSEADASGLELPTPWTKQARTSAIPWPQHPRPDLVRPSWSSLNGIWKYMISETAVLPKGTDMEAMSLPVGKHIRKQGNILVPFSLESTLGGVSEPLDASQVLWYQRVFDTPETVGPGWPLTRHLLHFEAVDYNCTVTVNGQLAGNHAGGSTPFSFDVSNLLEKKGPNSLIVRVLDATDNYQAVGKESEDGGGIFYSKSSGIRQSVWLESVPETYVRDLRIKTTIKPAAIHVQPDVFGTHAGNMSMLVEVSETSEGDRESGKLRTVAEVACSLGVNDVCSVIVPEGKLWTPETPHLYTVQVVLKDDKGGLVDKVSSYAGIRTVGKKADKNGNLLFTLNGQFIFHWGVLDQGWWPDGGLTPPSEEAMRADVDFLKAAGFNTIRKHMKVENRRFYEYCDQVGMMVWQDFPAAPGCLNEHTPCNNVTRNVSSEFVTNWKGTNFTAQKEPAWPEAAHGQFMAEMKEMVDALRNYPSIVVWTPFNENWGQHRTLDVGKWLKAYDSSRLLNIASGGNFWPVGDIADYHDYPEPSFPLKDARFRDYVKVAGEFGGHALPVKNHTWDTPEWFYAIFAATETTSLKERYAQSLLLLSQLQSEGLAAGIYTQTTDVETELNGLMTYDRVAKLEPRFLRHALKLAGLMNFTLCHDELPS